MQQQPLAGRSVAITRPAEQAEALAHLLEARGATVRTLSTIEIVPLADPAPLDAALAQLASYDWLLFTSVNGVRAVADRLAATGRTWAARGRARVAAIGPATAAALADLGVAVDLVPAEYVAEGILAELGNVAGQHLLLPRADIARQALAGELRLRGAEVDEVSAYTTRTRTLSAAELRALVETDRPDVLTFTSSSTVRGLVQSLEGAGYVPARALAGILLAAIGPITACTLREAGLEPSLVAERYTMEGLVAALVERFAPQTQAPVG